MSMSKTSDFTQSEKGMPQMQTLTNRDFINRIYILRYEDCLEVYSRNFDATTASNFANAVERLYASVITPRYANLKLKYKEEFKQIRLDISESESKGNISNVGKLYRRMMDLIGRNMWSLGINRPEKDQADVDHVAVDELEVVE
jgi:hypothetical protein